MLTVYVDDFIMAGIDHHLEWDRIRAAITTTTPEKVGRVLGVHFNFETCSASSPCTSKVTMDMDNYAGQAITMYESVPGSPPLKGNIHYPWLEPTIEQINNEAQENSGTVFGHCAASLLMK